MKVKCEKCGRQVAVKKSVTSKHRTGRSKPGKMDSTEKNMKPAIVVEADTKGEMTGRNGVSKVVRIVLTQTYANSPDVLVDGVNSKFMFTRGGLRVTCEAMDELCRKWLVARGKA